MSYYVELRIWNHKYWNSSSILKITSISGHTLRCISSVSFCANFATICARRRHQAIWINKQKRSLKHQPTDWDCFSSIRLLFINIKLTVILLTPRQHDKINLYFTSACCKSVYKYLIDCNTLLNQLIASIKLYRILKNCIFSTKTTNTSTTKFLRNFTQHTCTAKNTLEIPDDRVCLRS